MGVVRCQDGQGQLSLRGMGWDRMGRGLVGLGGEVCLAPPGVGLGSLCCRRGSSGLFHLLGWPPMCSEDLKMGLSGRLFPQYLNAQWVLQLEARETMRG